MIYIITAMPYVDNMATLRPIPSGVVMFSELGRESIDSNGVIMWCLTSSERNSSNNEDMFFKRPSNICVLGSR